MKSTFARTNLASPLERPISYFKPTNTFRRPEIRNRYFVEPTSDEKSVNSPETNELLHPELYLRTHTSREEGSQKKDQFKESINALKEQLENLKGDIEKKIETETYTDHQIGQILGNNELSAIQKTAKLQKADSILSQNDLYEELVKMDRHPAIKITQYEDEVEDKKEPVERNKNSEKKDIRKSPVEDNPELMRENRILRQQLEEAKLAEKLLKMKYSKELKEREEEKEEHERTVNGLQEEIKKLVETINLVTLKQAQTQRMKQKLFDNKRISELEEEINKLTNLLQVQRNSEADLRKNLAETKAELKEKEYEALRSKRTTSQDLRGAKELKRELENLKDSSRILKREMEQKVAKLRVEMLGKVEEIASAYERISEQKDEVIKELEETNADLEKRSATMVNTLKTQLSTRTNRIGKKGLLS